jgi:hypothetical protein
MWTRKFSRVILFWYFAGWTFNTTTLSKARSEWDVMQWKSGSRPWTLCSFPWKRCRTPRKLFAKWSSICMILSVSLIWSLAVMVRPYCPAPIYLREIHSSALWNFDKIKVSFVAGQRPSSTSVMFYLRVLPPGISKISSHCTTSYELLTK